MARNTVDVTYHGPSGLLSVDGHDFVAGERVTITRSVLERVRQAALSLRGEHRMTIHEDTPEPKAAAPEPVASAVEPAPEPED